jgi:Dolichyl-phosphate-mannose-protein mannosyltransferase
MTVAYLSATIWRPIDRLAAALVDPQRRDRTVIQLLVAYVGVWTLYGVLSKASQDVHFDMAEAVAWSREPALGYPKHPPLSAWIVKVWFEVFPLSDWAYYLLAMVVAASGLWIAWMLSARWLDGEKRAAGLALLTLVPFFNFHALKYNANTVLIPLWAATTLWFLRSFETRDPLSAALAGLAAAAAMLGKYWSIVLILGLGLVAISNSRRAVYFRSPAPWITVAVGLLAFSPHIAWLFAHDFESTKYAFALHWTPSLWESAVGDAKFLMGAVAYIVVPLALAFVATRPSIAAFGDTLWPGTADRRLAAGTFWAPLLVAMLGSLAAKVFIVSLWTMSAFTLLPVVLLSSPLVRMQHEALVRVLALAVAAPIAATLTVAFIVHFNGVAHHASHYRLLAEAVERAWQATSKAPLGFVGSDLDLASGMAFYLSDRPSTLDVIDRRHTPWADNSRIVKRGAALACAMQDDVCMRSIDALASGLPRGKRTEVEIARTYLGSLEKAERYLIITLPPESLR